MFQNSCVGCTKFCIRGSEIQTRGTKFYKSAQLLAYADDLHLISRTAVDLSETFSSLVQAAEDTDLKINDDKAKYMVTGKGTISYPTVSVGCYNFQKMETLSTWEQ